MDEIQEVVDSGVGAGLNVYQVMINVIGPLPGELTWVYGFSTIFVIVIMFSFVLLPWYLILKK